MPRSPTLHPYSDRASLERLLILIATFVQYPGVGERQPDQPPSENHHQALLQVRTQMHQVAHHCGIHLPEYSLDTLRKDLKTLRTFGILQPRMYRWGYYLGTGALTRHELQLALQALLSQATHQGDRLARTTYTAIERRLRGLNLELEGQLFYPVRTHYNRAIIYTDPEEMAQCGENRHTLFHELETLETAILQGQAVELHQNPSPFNTSKIGPQAVYPLQLLYSDIAWYLLFEDYKTQHLAIARVDRFKDTCTILPHPSRGIDTQRSRLDIAHTLLKQGWGLYLGNPEEQQQELAGTLPLITVKVRFFPAVLRFIQEGDRRHPSQTLKPGPKDKQGQLTYLDYCVPLPGRSLGEFSRWVNRFMHHAKVIEPAELVEQYRLAAQALVEHYTQ